LTGCRQRRIVTFCKLRSYACGLSGRAGVLVQMSATKHVLSRQPGYARANYGPRAIGLALGFVTLAPVRIELASYDGLLSPTEEVAEQWNM